MNTVDKFLKEKDEYIQRERNKLLLQLGFYEKEYAPDCCYSEEYYEQEVTPTGSVYFKKVPIKVTEAEWDKIVSKMKEVEKINYIKDKITYNQENINIEELESNGKSKIANVVKGFAWIISICLCLYSFPYMSQVGNFWPLVIAVVISIIVILSAKCIVAIFNYLAEICYMLRRSFNKK